LEILKLGVDLAKNVLKGFPILLGEQIEMAITQLLPILRFKGELAPTVKGRPQLVRYTCLMLLEPAQDIPSERHVLGGHVDHMLWGVRFWEVRHPRPKTRPLLKNVHLAVLEVLVPYSACLHSRRERLGEPMHDPKA
jgi:hypothetical protein